MCVCEAEAGLKATLTVCIYVCIDESMSVCMYVGWRLWGDTIPTKDIIHVNGNIHVKVKVHMKVKVHVKIKV